MQKLESNDTLKGFVTILLFDETGNIKETREFRNLVVSVGRTGSGERISNPATGVLTGNWIRLGTGTTAAGASDTNLIGGLAASEAKSSAYTSLGIGSWKLVQTWGTGEAIAAIQESGVFFGSWVSMLCRATFAQINKQSSDTLEVTWGFTLTSS